MRLLTTILLVLLPVAAAGQPQPGTSADFKARFERQVKATGITGPGVESILDRWEAALPDDPDMLDSRFLWAFNKAQKTEVTVKDQEKFMGNKPLLSLPDSTARGGKKNYFEEVVYDPQYYAIANQYIDKAISLRPLELKYRFDKISALISYEKESPDMATSDIRTLIDFNAGTSPAWTFKGEKAPADLFGAAIQEYCYTFFLIGSEASFESFRLLSEKMLSYRPKDPVFLDNLGSYWLIARKDNKTALSYYKKVLKVAPDDYTALKNINLMARNSKDVKLEKKYLPALIKASTDEKEKESLKARLEMLSAKKK